MYTPNTDGIDHINIYSKGKTLLGRLLSNFAYTPFIYPEYALFYSVEGFWYYYLSDCKFNELKLLSGYQAKAFGKTLKCRMLVNDDIPIILEAIRHKLRQNRNIIELLKESDLPLTHYYAYLKGNEWKIVEKNEYNWIIDEYIRIRNLLKKYL
jgi:hypothetical protein